MDKEKQAVEAALEELENIVYGTELENYVGAVRSSYNDIEKEIAALKAEIELMREALRVVLDSAGKDWYPHDDDRAIVENALNHSEKPDSL